MRMSFSNLISSHYAVLPWLLLLLLGINNPALSEVEEYQTYIIHLDHSQKPASFLTPESWHRSTLKSLSSPADDKEQFLYSYNHVIHGFSARLTPSQLSEIENSPAHLATYPESFGNMLTTHTPKFLGLEANSGIWPAASYGKDVIVGILDTGLWPESESFNDKGMSPVPRRWKGKCENGTAFNGPTACNRKLIGAQSFSKGLYAAGVGMSKESDFDSARDYLGHGTHTSSTAVGKHVDGVSHFGYAKGTARGVAPGARLAMYKVLWETDTFESAATDVLAGIDQAISDGVDIISMSIRVVMKSTPYFDDVIAIASLSAIEKGIFVVCAAGNSGLLGSKTIFNGAPWITTVGAGTLDRSFTATMTLENGLTIEGTSYFPESIYITNATLYYGKGNISKEICKRKALDRKEVAGKVVLCDNSTDVNFYRQIKEVERVGAYAGIFLTGKSFYLPPDYYKFPSLLLPIDSGSLVREYVTRVTKPKVKSMRFVLTRLGTKPAPQVAYFSSRGPDPITPGVLKPDILAPGADVLAAVAPNKPIIKIGKYDLVSDYALYSGTSMATPHVAGVGALLKAIHRDWSPAAIRSAIMTTAYTVDNAGTTLKDQQRQGHFATPLDFGAGHIDPNKAMDPGLIYDMDFQDYIEFLCRLGYTKKQMIIVTRRSQWSCNQKPRELNYPSFMATFTNKTSYPASKKFSRVVTNVGDETAVYRAVVESPSGMRIRVEPDTLTFTHKYQKQGFVVSIEVADRIKYESVTYGYLKWIDQNRRHVVSSPIVAINF